MEIELVIHNIATTDTHLVYTLYYKKSDPIVIELHGRVISFSTLLFFVQCCALLKNSEIKATVSNEVLEDLPSILSLLKYAGLNAVLTSNQLLMTNQTFVHDEETLVLNFTNCAESAEAFAILFAAKSMQVDMVGLHTLNGPVISDLQRALYKLNVRTDFCDHSKFKIYNDKKLKAESINQLKKDTLTPLYFMPLAIVNGKFMMELSSGFEEQHVEWISLLKAFSFILEKEQTH